MDATEAFLKEYKPTDPDMDDKVWLEIYYLTGYIMEGLVVYYVYKKEEWEKDKSIDEYDEAFTKRTGLAFRADPNNDYIKVHLGGHRYQFIKSHVIEQHYQIEFNGVPYLGDGTISPIVRRLISTWGTHIRYFNKNGIGLNKHNLELLIKTYRDIYKFISDPSRF